MSITIFQGVPWGVYKYAQAEGTGTTGPRVVSALSTGVNTVRVTFDRNMNFDFNPRAVGLIRTSYQIEKLLDSSFLDILKVTRISDTVVELMTTDQQNTTYRLTVLEASDVWDQNVDPLYDTADFTGTAPLFPSAEDLGSFFGLEGGMQHELSSGILPDFDAPYLANQNPVPGQSNISPSSPVILEVLDLAPGLNAGSVWIKVEGNDAWKNNAQQAGYTVAAVPVANGYRYTITPDIALTPSSTITVEVYAEDTNPIPNVLNTSYWFQTRGDDPPVIFNEDPQPGETGVAVTVQLSFDVNDNLGVDPAETIITIQDVIAYQNEANQNGFSVIRTPITQGYNYQVTHPVDWPYNTWIKTNVFVRDIVGTPLTQLWQFLTQLDTSCFTGPLNDTEAELLTPFASLDYCERLRQSLLASVVINREPIEGARAIFLRAHSQELAPVLFNLVVTPTPAEARVRLCNKATNLAVSNYLRRRVNLLPGAIRELRSLGIPHEHAALLNAYAREDQPNTEVPLACLIVLLAKAFE